MGCGSSKNQVDVSPDYTQEGYQSTPTEQQYTKSQSRNAVVPQDKTKDFSKEFPSPSILRLANAQYTSQKKPLRLTDEGDIDAYPCPSSKNEIYNPEEYAYLDDHCVKATARLCKQPLHDLVSYLTQDERTKTDVGKARAIYRWIAAQHVSTLPQDTAADTPGCAYSFLTVHDGRRSWRYTELFVKMCQCAGLMSRKITGLVKASTYKIGDRVTKDDSESTWAAVLIDNTWRLVDAHWGATYINDPNTGEWVLLDDEGSKKREAVSGAAVTHHFYCNDFYFLTNPEEFVYNHLASDPKWQLLARPVTVEEFEQMAKLSASFFELGMELTDYRKCVLNAKNGEAELTFEMPPDCDMSFTYSFWISTKGQDDEGMTNADSFKGIKLERYIFLQRVENIIKATINFPVSGKFKIDLFGRKSNISDEKGSSTHSHICAYVIYCDKPKNNCQPLPENSIQEWGPTFRSEKAGLQAITHTTGTVKMLKGEADVEFKADDDVEILAKLSGSSDDNLEHYVIHYRDGDKIIVRTKVPEKGQYALKIFSKRKGEEGSFNGVCTYLVDADTAPVDKAPFPNVNNGLVGPSSKFGSVLKLLSPNTYMNETDETEMLFIFKVLSQVDLMCHLKKGKQDGSTVDKTDMVMESKEGDKYTCHVRFPEPGNYLLEVFSRPSDAQDGTTYSFTTNCLVKALKGNVNAVPFPKTFSSFKEGKLLKPLSGVLPSKQMVHFALTAPQACDVVAIVNGEWTHLSRGENGIWEGDATTGAAGTTAKISGKSDTGGDSYWGYMNFEVKDGVELPLSAEEVEAIQKRKEEQRLEQLRLEKEAEEARIAAINKKNEEKRKAEEAKLAAQKLKEEEAFRKRREKAQKFIKALTVATKKRDGNAIRKAMSNITKNKYQNEAESEMQEAKQVLESLARMERLQQAILNMDQATMSEIKSYNKPPDGVHDIMRATFLMLGEHEGKTQKWTDCQSFITNITSAGKISLQRRVKTFNVEKTHPEVAARVKEILKKWKRNDVVGISEGTAIFYDWAVGMVDELYFLNRDAKNVPPANISRQTEILKIQK